MKDAHNFFHRTRDAERIFYSTNFKPTEVKKDILVFNYGLVCSNFHWKNQISFFEDLGYPILIHDFRGHYQSSGKDNLDQITFKNISMDLYEILNELEIESCTLIGHSMGVNISLEFAKMYPQLVKNMILISGTILPVHNVLMNTHLTSLLNPLMKKGLEKFPKPLHLFWKYGGWTPIVKKIILDGGFNPKRVGYDFIETYLNKLGELGPDLFYHLINQMQAHDIMAHVDQINIPSLIMGGNRDKVIPNFQQRLIHEQLPQSELYISHEGSHVPQVDYPDMFNERISFFLEKHK